MFKHGKKEQQISLDDRFLRLPQSILESFQKSWAEDFYKNIFLRINEERFSVLFSDTYSRPNKPVNILVSLLILKELHGLTDEQLISSLYFDYRYQYALGIEDFEKEKICINTLTNFRQRLVENEVKTKKDLLKEEVDELSSKLAELINLDKSMARMDSFMLSSSCKKLT
ncbi:MAG TPA: transposase [Bacillales bacterium]|nr:transposase [Bacillales bacterium]